MIRYVWSLYTPDLSQRWRSGVLPQLSSFRSYWYVRGLGLFIEYFWEVMRLSKGWCRVRVSFEDFLLWYAWKSRYAWSLTEVENKRTDSIEPFLGLIDVLEAWDYWKNRFKGLGLICGSLSLKDNLGFFFWYAWKPGYAWSLTEWEIRRTIHFLIKIVTIFLDFGQQPGVHWPWAFWVRWVISKGGFTKFSSL